MYMEREISVFIGCLLFYWTAALLTMSNETLFPTGGHLDGFRSLLIKTIINRLVCVGVNISVGLKDV